MWANDPLTGYLDRELPRRRWFPKLRLRWKQLFWKTDPHEYLNHYSETTDLRVQINPHEAVGGHWSEMGLRQFEFLKAQGLEPHHALLDLGCGTLRAGQHFIRYLDPDKYTGLDISREAIISGEFLVSRHALWNKRPKLVRGTVPSVLWRFPFDYVLAQSVFTHLMPQHIEDIFDRLPDLMTPGSKFFFTYHEGPMARRGGIYSRREGAYRFVYPRSFFESLARPRELKDHEFVHPNGQKMLELVW